MKIFLTIVLVVVITSTFAEGGFIDPDCSLCCTTNIFGIGNLSVDPDILTEIFFKIQCFCFDTYDCDACRQAIWCLLATWIA
ncbi:hypothetical protein DMENIID0001_021020 [Sergentomyia squamirostris]